MFHNFLNFGWHLCTISSQFRIGVIYTQTHTRTCIHTNWGSHIMSWMSILDVNTYTHSMTHSRSRPRPRACAHSLCLSLLHTHTHSHSLFLSFSVSRTCKHIRTHTHTHIHICTHTSSTYDGLKVFLSSVRKRFHCWPFSAWASFGVRSGLFALICVHTRTQRIGNHDSCISTDDKCVWETRQKDFFLSVYANVCLWEAVYWDVVSTTHW